MAKAKALVACRAQLSQMPVEAPKAEAWHEACVRLGEQHPERCPSYGGQLGQAGMIARGGSPPTPQVEALAV